MAAALSVAGLDKRFGPVHAVADVSLDFAAGRIHAVVGENGAGKSTLLRMAAGLVTPDAGLVSIDGVPLGPHNAREAIRRGVGMVQQHFALVGALTALDNVMLGAEPVGRWGRLDRSVAQSRAQRMADDIGAKISWQARVETLGVGDRQRIEIVRALSRDARIVILDEPTAVLTPGEAEVLYTLLRRLADAGRTVVVVTHRLDEVRDHADDVSVLRRGRLVATRAVVRRDDGWMRELTADAMGGDVALPALARRSRVVGPAVLSLDRIASGRALVGATLTVHAGEVVGVAGVDGNGQRELVRVIAGLDRPDRGELRGGAVAVVHADRRVEGLVLDGSVADNLVLGELARFTQLGWVRRGSLARAAQARLDRAGVVPPTLDRLVRLLSGGNQQKVVVARAMARLEFVAALVLAEPTRGVDAAARSAIHVEIARAADEGKAVLIVSSDLAELRALCDRILVLARGRVVSELAPDAPDALFGEAMLGRIDERPGGAAA